MDKTDPEIILITNSIYPYHLHNVAILSLPFGAAYHFRYERRYFQLDEAGIDGLAGKAGILVLRDFERAAFIPLRTFRVLSVDNCGDFVYLDLQFLYFVQYVTERSELDAGLPARDHELCLEREKYSNAIDVQVLVSGARNERNQHLEKLILVANPSELARIKQNRASEGGQFAYAWSQVVNVLGGMTGYRQVCFHLIGAVLELQSGESVARFTSHWRAGLILETGKVYLLQIYQLIGNRSSPPKPGFKIKLACLEGHLALLHSELAVDGAYDRLSFVAVVLPQERETNQSEILVTCDQPIPDPADTTKSSSIPPASVQLQIRWPLLDRLMKWIGNPVMFVSGAALFVRADNVRQWLTPDQNTTYVVQLIGLALLAIGGRTMGFLTSAFKSGPPGTRA